MADSSDAILFSPIRIGVLDLPARPSKTATAETRADDNGFVTDDVICVGGFRSRAAMEHALCSGLCDAVSAGRPFIADPSPFRHLRDNEAGTRCVDCNACVGHLGAQAADCYHPRVRAEKDAMLAGSMKH